jgi:hypothetical protein
MNTLAPPVIACPSEQTMIAAVTDSLIATPLTRVKSADLCTWIKDNLHQ